MSVFRDVAGLLGNLLEERISRGSVDPEQQGQKNAHGGEAIDEGPEERVAGRSEDGGRKNGGDEEEGEETENQDAEAQDHGGKRPKSNKEKKQR